ncbi:MAG: hypothetical protein FE043_03860 [Thermoplasmata archaeon]|nr:MAG: hypothetical protein FE043_03860 [Thermoplasmata archaeon]
MREEDRGDIEVAVSDIFGNPVDGVRVTVFGSWKANNFKDKVWDKTVGEIWSKLPDAFREKWQENYTKMREWYHERVPGAGHCSLGRAEHMELHRRRRQMRLPPRCRAFLPVPAPER